MSRLLNNIFFFNTSNWLNFVLRRDERDFSRINLRLYFKLPARRVFQSFKNLLFCSKSFQWKKKCYVLSSHICWEVRDFVFGDRERMRNIPSPVSCCQLKFEKNSCLFIYLSIYLLGCWSRNKKKNWSSTGSATDVIVSETREGKNDASKKSEMKNHKKENSYPATSSDRITLTLQGRKIWKKINKIIEWFDGCSFRARLRHRTFSGSTRPFSDLLPISRRTSGKR